MSVFPNYSERISPVKLKTGMLYNISNTFRHTVFFQCFFNIPWQFVSSAQYFQNQIWYQGKNLPISQIQEIAKQTRSWWRLRQLRSKPTHRIGENQNHKTTRLRLQRWEILALSHHSGNFGDNRYCDKSDLMFLISHVTPHNHLFKWSFDFMIGSPSS